MINREAANKNSQSAGVDLWEKGAAWALGQLILLAVILFVPARIGGLPDWPESLNGISSVIGLLIVAVGFFLIVFSGIQLGSNLTIFPRPKADGSLTQTGAYGIVRHPMYSSALLLALGLALLRSSFPALIMTLILGLFLDRKARREEVWLIEKYPEYRNYQKHVRKLIPWLY